jgi:hypothetical protein
LASINQDIHLLIKPDDASQLPILMHWVGWYASICDTFTPIQKQQVCVKGFMIRIPTTGTTAD